MDIKTDNYQITVTCNELIDIAYYVRASLYNTLKDDWVLNQNNWKQNEKQRLYLLRKMFFSLGRPDLYIDIGIQAKEIFKEFNKKTEKK